MDAFSKLLGIIDNAEIFETKKVLVLIEWLGKRELVEGLYNETRGFMYEDYNGEIHLFSNEYKGIKCRVLGGVLYSEIQEKLEEQLMAEDEGRDE